MSFCRDCELVMQKSTFEKKKCTHFEVSKIYQNRNNYPRDTQRIYTKVSLQIRFKSQIFDKKDNDWT